MTKSPNNQMVKCPSCGADVEASAMRCTKCGAKLDNKKFNSSSKLIIGVIVVIIVIAIIGAFASGIFTNHGPNGVDDSSQSKAISEKTVNNDSSSKASSSQDSSSSSSNVYWASAKADKFHLPTCEWAQKIGEKNKVVYNSREDAIKDGKEPCGACNP